MEDSIWLHTIELGPERRIVLIRGDITVQDVCAIVNAANSALAPGGGVCGAIYAAAGDEPFREAAEIVHERGRIPTGEAVATGGGRLPARHIVHAVGPVWHGGTSGEQDKLASAYRESIRIADALGCDCVAFPSISTGIYGFPLEFAAPIAIEAIADALRSAVHVREVRAVLHDSASADAWLAAAASFGC